MNLLCALIARPLDFAMMFYNYYHIIPPTLITTAEKSTFHFLLKLGMIQTMVLLYLLRQTFMQLLST